ncbi:hypothetical protein QUF70_06895 [Desulfobacterales bacterium HSG17]|nr:hypothetical protein [Desulfobacterales bacterium HSG17]
MSIKKQYHKNYSWEQENVLSEKEYIKRSVIDRRSLLDRRMFNRGTKYQGPERRMRQGRRQGWERRYDWESIDRMTSFCKNFKIHQPYKSL